MRIWRASVALAMATILFGCAAAATNAPTPLSRSAEQAERSAEVARLQWPHDAAPTSFVEYPEDAVFEPGAGANQADTVWYCAWSAEWLSERTEDAGAASEALRQLEKVKTLPLWGNLDSRGRQAITDALSKARQGDPLPLQSQREAFGCSS